MKKNILDTEIEMIDLNNIDDMEISYDGSSEPNEELANDVEMVMQETQVISQEEIAEKLSQEIRPEDIPDDDTIIMSPEDTAALSNAAERVKKKMYDTDEVLAREAEGSNGEEGSYYINADSNEDEDYEFETSVPKDTDSFRPVVPQKKKSHSNSKKKKKKGIAGVFGNIGSGEFIAILGALLIVALLMVVGLKVLDNSNHKKDLQQFVSLGVLFSDMDGIGKEGIKAIGSKAQISSIETADDDEEKSDVKENEGEKILGSASVNFTSIEKDLKIKFTDKKTGKLITGVKFEVEAKGPKGDKFSWVDSDMDGVIYVENLKAGNYEVKVLSVGNYEFPDTATVVKVQDTIVYQAINVLDEAVDMSKVNLATEDNQGNEADTGTVLKDTVEYVSSTQNTVERYEKVDRDKVTAVAFNFGDFRKVDGLTVTGPDKLKVGETGNYGCRETGVTDIKYSSSNSDVLSIDDSGKATAKSKGSAEIKITGKIKVKEKANPEDEEETEVEKEVSGSITVTVEEVQTEVKVDKIEVEGSKTMKVDETITLTAKVTPSGAKQSVVWSTSDDKIATVDEYGKVKAKAKGKVTITAKAKDDSGVTGKIEITIDDKTVKVTKIKLSGEKDIYVGDTLQLTAKVEPSDATTALEWKSSNDKVATVDSKGLVTAKAEGEVKITASADGISKESKTIKVSKVDKTKNLIYKDGKNTYEVYVKNSDGKFVRATVADKEAKKDLYYKTTRTEYTGWQTIDGKVYYYDKNKNKVTGEQVIQGAKYNFASDGSLSMGGGTRGIDVSAYQGNIDWSQVKNAGISYAIIRVGFRGYTQGGLIYDSNYDKNIKGANNAGIKVGLYFFSQATNEREAIEEASLCVNIAKNYKISYPIFIDSEFSNPNHNGRADGLSQADRTKMCKAFCETIKSAGYTPGVYASKSWFYNRLDVNSLNQYKIWMAHYCTTTDYKYKYDLWQHSSTGKIPGIDNNVDLDNSYLGY